MNICVVGAGAIGGWVAARLALAGHKVMALNSRGPLDGLEIDEAGEKQSAMASPRPPMVFHGGSLLISRA